MKSAPRHLELAANRVRRWWPWLLISLLLHLPLTPVGPLLGLLTLLLHLRDEVPAEPVEALEGIPVELLADSEHSEAHVTAPAAEPESVVVTPPKPKPAAKSVEKEAPDAGVADAGPDASVAEEDAGASDGGMSEDAAVAALDDAGTADAGAASATEDAGTSKHDPFAIAGDFPRAPRSNVNVKLHLFASALQKHPAGAAIASLLTSEPQWRDFLGPGGLDPIRDLSRLAIYGPQLVDSSKVAVFLEYTKDTDTVRKAVDALVTKTTGGRWSTENKKRVAYVKAGGADRVIIFFPGKMIAIVPPGPVQTQLIAAKTLPNLPVGTDDTEVFQGSLRTPHRVRFFRHLGIEIPKSIAEAKLFVSALSTGGASLQLRLVDETPDAARAHFDELERQASALTLGLVSIKWRQEQSELVAEARLSPLQIAAVLSRINQEIAGRRR